jgi:hypothetical protein
MSASEILGEQWLCEYLQQLEDQGLSTEQKVVAINEWVRAAVAYGCWMLDEGFSNDQWDAEMHSAIWSAQFDLRKFPKCPSDKP